MLRIGKLEPLLCMFVLRFPFLVVFKREGGGETKKERKKHMEKIGKGGMETKMNFWMNGIFFLIFCLQIFEANKNNNKDVKNMQRYTTKPTWILYQKAQKRQQIRRQFF